MSSVRKLVSLPRATAGLGLYLFYNKTLDLSIFRGKRIAVIGPADSATKSNLGTFIDQFDLVVRLNKAPDLLVAGTQAVQIGRRIDVLFHNFLENPSTGGSRLDLPTLHRLGVRYLVNPIPTTFGKRNCFNFYKKYLQQQPTYLAPSTPYEQVINRFGSKRPTTGFAALLALLSSPFRELYISGFTFFKTPYGHGYRDHLIDMETNKAHIQTEDIHDPTIEYELFVEQIVQLNTSPGRLYTDTTLAAILLRESGVQVSTY